MGYSKYVGRVGTLAVALGVGFAVVSPAGIAWADATETSSAPAGSDSSTGDNTGQAVAATTFGDEQTPTTESSDEPGQGTVGTATTPSSEPEQTTSPTAQTVEVAPGVVVSSSGGAKSSDDEGPSDDNAASEDTAGSGAATTGSSGRETLRQNAETLDKPPVRTHAQSDVRTNTATEASDDPKVSTAGTASTAATGADDTASITVSTPSTQRVSTPPVVASPVTTINALLSAFVAPIVSQILGAIPGVPANSPLGWVLLAAARRELFAPVAARSLAAESAPMTMSLMAAANLAPTVDVTFGIPVPTTGAVTGQVNATDPEGGTLTYTVTAPPSSGNLVFDSATKKFTYTPTTAQRIAAAASATTNDTIAMTITVSDGTNSVPTVVNVPVSEAPLTRAGEIGSVGDAHAVAIAGTRAYVTNKAAGTVTVIDTVTNTIVKTIAVGSSPDGIAVKPDGTQIYVISSESSTLRALNTSTGAIAKTLKIAKPSAIAISPTGQTLYVTSLDAGTLIKVTTTFWNTATVRLPAGSRPTDVIMSPDRKTIYVISGRSTGGGTVAAIGSNSYSSTTIGNLAAAPTALAISPDSKRLFVTTADSKLNVVNIATKSVVGSYGVTGVPAGVVLSNDGSTLLVTNTAGTVSAHNSTTGALLSSVATRTATTAMSVPPTTALSADGTTLYVTDFDADKVHLVSLVPANRAPQVGTPVLNPPNTTNGAVSGRVVATDADGDVLKHTLTTAPKNGSVSVAADGTFTYTPTATARHAAAKVGAATEVTTDTFTVTVTDTKGATATVSVTVAISPANAAPSAPTVTSSTDTSSGIVTGTVKFVDADNDTLTYTATSATKGTLTMQPNGSFTFTPTAAAREAAAVAGATAATKTDTVTVTVVDGYGGTATTTLTVTIVPAAGSFQASAPTQAIGAVTGTVSGANTQTGALSYTVTAGPTKGLVKVDAATGTFVYVPNVDARYAAEKTPGIDTDVFTVAVTDTVGVQTLVTVTVQVAPPQAGMMDQRSTTIAVTLQEMYFFSQAETDMTLDLLKQAGVTNVRILVPWMGVEYFDDWWSWENTDRMVNGAAARDIEVLAVLNSPPMWASVPDVPILAGRPADPAEFAEYASMVATRYAGKVSAYEIWNEPNYWGFWAPGPNAAQYTELLKAAYPVIKAADPNAVVVAGSVATVLDWFNITVNPVRFVQEMYDAGAAGYFDALAVHPYLYSLQFSAGATTIHSPLWQVNEIYKLMVANGDGNKKIWATEYGQPSHLISEASQAEFITDFLRTWRTLPYAGPAIVQTIKDNTESDPNAASMGLLRADWTPKQAWFDLQTVIAENQQILLGL